MTGYRQARGLHSDPNDSEMMDFVNDLISEIRADGYGAGRPTTYLGGDGDDAYVFTVSTDDFDVEVAIDSNTVMMEPDFDPSGAVDYPLDLNDGEFNVPGEAYAIIEQIDAYQEEFDLMNEDEMY